MHRTWQEYMAFPRFLLVHTYQQGVHLWNVHYTLQYIYIYIHTHTCIHTHMNVCMSLIQDVLKVGCFLFTAKLYLTPV